MTKPTRTDPWFPLSCHYPTNGKITDAGYAAAICHMYLLAIAHQKSDDSDGRRTIDDWDAKKIRRWAGVFRRELTVEDFEQGMKSATDEDLVELFTDEGEDWVRPNDFEDFLMGVKRNVEASRKRRVRKMSANVPKCPDKTGHVPKCPSTNQPTNQPTKPTDTYSSDFEQFWSTYPNKKGKRNAYKAYIKATKEQDWPGLAKVLAAVKAHTSSKDWTKDGGEYIPHPATWLNGGRWSDDIDGAPRKKLKRFGG